MTIRTLLVPICGGPEDHAALEMAANLARRFEAHVEVLHLRRDSREGMPYLGDGASGAMIEEIIVATEREADDKASRLKQQFDKWRAAHAIAAAESPPTPGGASAAWRQEIGPEDQVVAHHGRLTDLIVLPRPDLKIDLASLVFESALLRTGRPLLLAPSAAGPNTQFATVAIAWNGSAEAARALAAARPFLATASRVIAITANGDGNNAAPTPNLLSYLAWHGIKAEALVVEAKAVSEGAALLDETRRRKADLLVMGAYTHSRVRQMVFGGVTRHILAHAELPLLMAH